MERILRGSQASAPSRMATRSPPGVETMFSSDHGWTFTSDRRPRGLSRSSSMGSLHRPFKVVRSLKMERKASQGSLSSTDEGRLSTPVTSGSRADSELTAAESDGGQGDAAARAYAAFQARFGAEYAQQQRCAQLAMPRRHRLISSTLDAVRDSFNPAEGLEVAAAALAREQLMSWRTAGEQGTNCAVLAQPRLPKELEEEVELPSATRSWAEQQLRCEELARPHEQPEPEPSAVPVILRTAAEQQRRCAALSQSRAAASDEDQLAALWKDQLAARAAAPVSESVAAAQALLAEMRQKVASNAARSRPPSAHAGRGTAAPMDYWTFAAVSSLRTIVEELLWVVLLQVRSCPKGRPTSASGHSIAPTQSCSLEERLGNLLISIVGPVLRPVARKVLPPGSGLARRLRAEFPRLGTHLGLRESEETELPPVTLSIAELEEHIEASRSCRDRLLAMDLTKQAAARLLR